jgi:hypothetical protein
MRDLVNLLDPVVAIVPQIQTNDNTAIVGENIDTAGCDSLTFILALGTITDANATFAVTMEHGDNSALGDTAAVTATDLIGQTSAAGVETATALANAAFTFAADKKCRKIGYSGGKRYLRLTVTPTGNDAGALPVAAIAVRGYLNYQPAANPPA